MVKEAIYIWLKHNNIKIWRLWNGDYRSMDAYDQTEQKHCSWINQYAGKIRNTPTIPVIVVCVLHQSPANAKQFIVPKPIDTTAQWRLVKINDKVAIVKQSKRSNKPYHFVLQLKFKMTIVRAMHVWSELTFPQQSYGESFAVKSFKSTLVSL